MSPEELVDYEALCKICDFCDELNLPISDRVFQYCCTLQKELAEEIGWRLFEEQRQKWNETRLPADSVNE